MFYILVPLQNNKVKQTNSKFYGNEHTAVYFPFSIYGTVFVDSLLLIFSCDVFVSVLTGSNAICFGRENDGD